jgi:hypothetical protein
LVLKELLIVNNLKLIGQLLVCNLHRLAWKAITGHTADGINLGLFLQPNILSAVWKVVNFKGVRSVV